MAKGTIKAPSSRQAGAIVVAPAWAASGSFEVFKSQCAVLKDLGYDVCFVAIPQYFYDKKSFHESVQEYKRDWKSLRADTRCVAAYPLFFAQRRFRWFDKEHRLASEAFKEAKSAHVLGIPFAVIRFALTRRKLLIVCNHYFNVPFVERLRKYTFRRLRFVLETHDIQSNQIIVRKPSLTKNDHERSVHDEVSFCKRAAQLVNVSVSDQAFFRHALPCTPSRIIYPFVPQRPPNGNAYASTSFLIVASRNPSNIISLNWFLSKVWSRYCGVGTLKVVGNIDDAMREAFPQTYHRWQRNFVGKVENLEMFYQTAAIVLIPVIIGEGISIKFVEAMAFQKRILFSPLAIRGLPETVMRTLQSSCCRDAEEFLTKLTATERIGIVEGDERSASIYNQLFTWPRYRRLYGEVAASNEN